MTTRKPILCLDFDGVIHSYSSGWKGACVIPDPPVPGALTFIREAIKHFSVAIFSSRSHQPGGVEAMNQWLWEHLRASSSTSRETAELMANIDFPSVKPAAFLSIDDRALTFTGRWPNAKALLGFKPWNKIDPDEPDRPPHVSALQVPDGTLRRGATGQLWLSWCGEWARVDEDAIEQDDPE